MAINVKFTITGAEVDGVQIQADMPYIFEHEVGEHSIDSIAQSRGQIWWKQAYRELATQIYYTAERTPE